MNEYIIKNELLKQAFWGGSLCKNGYLKSCNGYFNADNNCLGRAFIEYCVSYLFNIRRFPGFEQYYGSDSNSKHILLHEFSLLNKQDIDDACSELKLYYNFVQRELINSKYVNNGKIKLVRSLRPFEINIATPQLKNKENEFIKLPVNIINSYAFNNALFRYGSPMSIVREVEIKKVIMYFSTLHFPEEVCCNYMHGGEFEVWVMEDNIFGELKLKRDCFKFDNLGDLSNENTQFYEYRESIVKIRDNPLFIGDSNMPRPCSWNKLTSWIIRRNRKQIGDLCGMICRK